MLNPVFDFISVLCDSYHVPNMLEYDDDEQDFCYKGTKIKTLRRFTCQKQSKVEQ
jgi:hypothetical protein